MRRLVFSLLLATGLLAAGTIQGQKYAFVDTEYILKSIPAYEAGQEQLDRLSEDWQAEIEAIYKEVAQLYQDYQKENVFLSGEMKVQRENDIVEKEKQAKALQRQYFGPEGILARKQQELMQPIQDKVAAAIRELAVDQNLAAVFDKSGGVGLIYINPKEDISDDVLELLGYGK
jgi:outer membrane protein